MRNKLLFGIIFLFLLSFASVNAVIEDDFDRADQSGWGTATNGNSWVRTDTTVDIVRINDSSGYWYSSNPSSDNNANRLQISSTPSRVDFIFNLTNLPNSAVYFQLTDDACTFLQVGNDCRNIELGINSAGLFRYRNSAGSMMTFSSSVTFVEGNSYDISFRNIDYTNFEFDIYVNDVLKQTDAEFYRNNANLNYITFVNTNGVASETQWGIDCLTTDGSDCESSSSNVTLTIIDEWDASAVNNVEALINGDTFTNTTGNILYTDIPVNASQTYDIALSGNNYFDKTYSSSTMETKTLSLFQSVITPEARTLITNSSVPAVTYEIGGMTNTTFHLKAGSYTVLTQASGYISQNDSFSVTALDNRTELVYLGNHTATIGVINARTSAYINGTKSGYIQNVANGFNQTFNFTTNTTSFFLEGGLIYEFVFNPVGDYATNTGLSFNYTASGTIGSKNLELYENNSILFTFKNGDTFTIITTEINGTLFNDNQTYNFNTSTSSYFLSGITGGTYTLRASTVDFNDVEIFVTVVNNEYQELNVFFGEDVTAKIFTVTDNSGDSIEGVVVTFTKELNGSTVTYGQKITDFSGAIQIYLNENTLYSLTAVKSGYETFSGDVTPFQDSYTINLEEEGSERFISSFDDISYASTFRYVINSTYASFDFSIVSPAGFLQYFGASTTYNGTTYFHNSTGSPSGGSIIFNITNINTSLENTLNVTTWFKSVNNTYIEWNTIYLVDAEKGTNNVATWNFSGLTNGAKATIGMFILIFLIGTGIAVSRRIFVGALLGMIGVGFCMTIGFFPVVYGTMTLITMALLIIGDLSSGENR